MSARLPDDEWLFDLLGRADEGAFEVGRLEPMLVRALEDTGEPSRLATYAGLLEGIRAPHGPLLWPEALADDDQSPEQSRRAGVLSGRVLMDLARTRVVGQRDALAAVSYAAALAAPQGQRALGELTVEQLIKAHLYACIVTERHRHAITAEDELVLFRWLCSQAAATVTEQDEAKVLRLRAKRHERAGPSRAHRT